MLTFVPRPHSSDQIFTTFGLTCRVMQYHNNNILGNVFGHIYIYIYIYIYKHMPIYRNRPISRYRPISINRPKYEVSEVSAY